MRKMEDLLHHIHGRAEWHSSAIRQHKWYQRWSRKRVFVQCVCALGGETVWCSTQTLVHPTYFCQNLNSQCLVWRVDGDELSPVSWLVRCCRGAAVADMDCIGAIVVAKVWGLVRLVVYTPLQPLHFLPPSFLIHQITHSCGNFNKDRKEGRKVTVRSHKVLLTKFTQRQCVLQDQDRVSACRLLCKNKTTKECVLSVHLEKKAWTSACVSMSGATYLSLLKASEPFVWACVG